MKDAFGVPVTDLAERNLSGQTEIALSKLGDTYRDWKIVLSVGNVDLLKTDDGGKVIDMRIIEDGPTHASIMSAIHDLDYALLAILDPEATVWVVEEYAGGRHPEPHPFATKLEAEQAIHRWAEDVGEDSGDVSYGGPYTMTAREYWRVHVKGYRPVLPRNPTN